MGFIAVCFALGFGFLVGALVGAAAVGYIWLNDTWENFFNGYPWEKSDNV